MIFNRSYRQAAWSVIVSGLLRIERSTRSLSFLPCILENTATASPPTATAAATTNPNALRAFRLSFLDFLDPEGCFAWPSPFFEASLAPNASTTRPAGFFPFFPFPFPARPPLYGFI